MRFAALITVLAVAEKLRENYIVLLPESIPFLAELMEGKPNANKQRCKTLWPLADTDLSESFTRPWGTSQEAVTSQSLESSLQCVLYCSCNNFKCSYDSLCHYGHNQLSPGMMSCTCWCSVLSGDIILQWVHTVPQISESLKMLTIALSGRWSCFKWEYTSALTCLYIGPPNALHIDWGW